MLVHTLCLCCAASAQVALGFLYADDECVHIGVEDHNLIHDTAEAALLRYKFRLPACKGVQSHRQNIVALKNMRSCP